MKTIPKRLNIFISFCIILFTSGIALAQPPADLVLQNAYVYTVDDDESVAQSVAIKGEKIIYVGSDEGAGSFIGPHTEVVNLNKKMVLPAFVDSHMHPAMSAYTFVFQVTLFDAYSHDAYIQKIAEFAESNPEMEWIQGGGFLRSLYDETGPLKEDLDAIDATRPIAITSADGHSMWVNSEALRQAGITSETPDPINGIIKRINGEPSGLLVESAMGLVSRFFPDPEKEDVKQAIIVLQEFLNSRGLTTLHDAMISPDAHFYYDAYNELAEEGKLTLRIRGSWHVIPTEDYLNQIDAGLELAQQFNHPHFKAHSFKFFADEVIEEKTGLLLEPYEDDLGWYGIKDWTDEDMVEAFTKINNEGFQIHTHAIGDGGVRYTLDALEKAGVTPEDRASLAHVQMATPEDIDRMGALGISAHMSPYWHVIDDYFWDLYEPYLGYERAYEQMYPHKSLFNAGVNVTLASDFWVSEPDIMYAIYSGMTRNLPRRIFHLWYYGDPTYSRVTDPYAPIQYGDIAPLGPVEERCSLEDMIESATINGAVANFLENEIGSIEKGKLADLVVLDKNLFKVVQKNIELVANAKILMTIFEGKIVYRVPGNANTTPTPRKRIITNLQKGF